MSSANPPYAVIFDFDGVLFESEPTHCEAFARILAKLGVSLDWLDYAAHCIGLSDREILARLTARHPALRDIDAGDFLNAKSQAYEDLTRSGFPPIDGAPQLIDRLRDDGIPLAICSGSRRAEIDRLLKSAGLLDKFDVIVATEDVSQSKPSPEGYLLAWRRLQSADPTLPARRCLVFEDAAAGIEAARAAGMPVVLLGPEDCVAAGAHPDARIATLAEATRDFIKRLL